ncbi:MAG: hopanoid C-3 methylase HpnR [Alphaproteobacteria bacterium]
MNVLFVHPGPLMYTKVFLRLEPLGLELVAAAAEAAGHEVRIIDLQVESQAAYHRLVRHWRPDAIAFSCNYLANVPEIIDLAKATKAYHARAFIAVGGHSASFVADDFLSHAEGAIDCVLKGEGEASIGPLLEAVEHDRRALAKVPGAVSAEGEGPPPGFVASLDAVRPARHRLRHRRKYFIGELDPCASIEFSRGCPWDCVFCSAWTFYGRSYRIMSPDHIIADLESIREPGVFLVDDVAFIHAEHAFAIGEAIERKGIKKRYYLETRGDVLLRNKEAFRFWQSLGIQYMFLGLEAIDEEGLKKYRKRVSLGRNFEALEFARSLDIKVAVNLIADPDWDHERFEVVRQWIMEVPEVVNISVNTPYPGTESWRTEERRLTSRDYRLYDIQHAVLPTRLPLPEFYDELVKTQTLLYKKHMGWTAFRHVFHMVAGCLARGQTNFLKSLWSFKGVYDPGKLLADHGREVRYAMPAPPDASTSAGRRAAYVHAPRGRASRSIDDSTERFVEETRMGASA